MASGLHQSHEGDDGRLIIFSGDECETSARHSIESLIKPSWGSLGLKTRHEGRLRHGSLFPVASSQKKKRLEAGRSASSTSLVPATGTMSELVILAQLENARVARLKLLNDGEIELMKVIKQGLQGMDSAKLRSQYLAAVMRMPALAAEKPTVA
ncbi:hypothetical protein BDK51DRAFT_30818 [Blyttiomyces helicus]|uniref:Uncharacterized protein n=1 Tax=Blyttiomyces helicus TaxID=388810 RepID=A0A4P9WQ29_9FUNG|nr:hypothetical protein BDK51DRAFT_30818 [Blyttiomyces helicus]|eukprot:RKO94682.1 hypothetical protein BDK51DRAFT_30818 [Blyttiomyces helicus]